MNFYRHFSLFVLFSNIGFHEKLINRLQFEIVASGYTPKDTEDSLTLEDVRNAIKTLDRYFKNRCKETDAGLDIDVKTKSLP